MKRPMLISAIAVLAACAAMAAHGQSAVAVLDSTAGNSAKGTIGFDAARRQGFRRRQGVRPRARYACGFHIHEKGDCSSRDGMSAGGHFNPTAKPHGNPGIRPSTTSVTCRRSSPTHRATRRFKRELAPMSVGAGVTEIVGKAVIVHKDADDYTTQPTGNSGARVACGVIRKP